PKNHLSQEVTPLPGSYTPRSDEGRLKLEELMNICTKLSQQVLDLEKEKDAQAMDILRLKKRVKRLERKRKSSTSQQRRRLYKQALSLDDDLDEEDASKQGKTRDKIEPMFKESNFDDIDNLVEEGMEFVVTFLNFRSFYDSNHSSLFILVQYAFTFNLTFKLNHVD
ncbi:hypothetical protein Tco_0106812, partial [Tanacetum coccineum]